MKGLDNVFPRLPDLDCPNVLVRISVPISKCSHRYSSGTRRTDSLHVVFCHSSARMLLPEYVSSLCHFVELVVQHSAEKEVVRVDAPPNVTRVADTQAWGNWASQKKPSCAVSRGVAKVFVSRCAVPVPSDAPSPQPTRGGHFNLWPESNLERKLSERHN